LLDRLGDLRSDTLFERNENENQSFRFIQRKLAREIETATHISGDEGNVVSTYRMSEVD